MIFFLASAVVFPEPTLLEDSAGRLPSRGVSTRGPIIQKKKREKEKKKRKRKRGEKEEKVFLSEFHEHALNVKNSQYLEKRYNFAKNP